MNQLFTTRQLNQVLPNVSGRHQNWAKYGLVVPAETHRKPSRKGNRHSIQDLVALGVLQQLFDSGIGAAEIRNALLSKDTFTVNGSVCPESDPRYQLSHFFETHGFDWLVVITKDLDGNTRICTHKGAGLADRGIASQAGSVTVINVGRIYEEITRRLAKIGDSQAEIAK